jgi:tetratricopeptide (TPR) repeat protein/serine/threonine protein kinase
MNPDQNQIKNIFLQAVEQHAPNGWPAFLDQACAGQPELRGRVEVLLQAHREAGTDPQRTSAEGATPVPFDLGSSAERPGSVIGPYRLLRQIGEGGMGAVFLAEQTEPVRRQVALKIIKPGMDSKQVIARFEAERQALALMDHPNIARVLDAGTTASGRPYFVMELVKGVPFTRYCDEHRLTPRQRLELFVPVCQAVQHAHQKGIIHRDLKPSNVLVTLYDGVPVPKVIDFGIAKATAQNLTERSLCTEVGQVVGTLEYMSPEQADLGQIDIDTRSDIYSLGVLLYELLTGTTPLERKRLRGAGFLEVLRLIREEEPPRPSTRLSTTDELPAIAASRGLEPNKLSGLLHGELDWIVMKALEKDRSRRYETATAFAADVLRYLSDEPVQACPPSAWYRFRKYARRNRVVLTTTAVVVAALLVGTGVSVWQAVVATQALQAETKARADETAARDAFDQDKDKQRARINSEISGALVELTALQGKIQAAGPAEINKWADALRDGRNRAEGLAANSLADPREAQKLRELLKAVNRVEKDRRIEARLEEFRIRRMLYGRANGPNEDTYAAIFRDYGIPIVDLDDKEAVQRIGDSAIKDSLVAALDDWAGLDYRVVGPHNKQLRIARLVVEKNRWHREYFDALLGSSNDLGKDRHRLSELARQPEALEQPPGTIRMLAVRLWFNWEATVDLLRKAQVRHPTDPLLNLELGWTLGKSAQVANQREATVYYRIAFALRPDSKYILEQLGKHLLQAGELDEAIAIYQEQIRRPDDFGDVWLVLLAAHRRKGDWEGILRTSRELAAKNPNDPLARCGIGMVLVEKGDFDAGIAEFEKVLRNGLDLWHEYEGGVHAALGWALERKGKLDEALKAYQDAILHRSHFQGEFNDPFPDPYSGLVHVLQKQRVPDPALVAFRDMARILQEKQPPDPTRTYHSRLIAEAVAQTVAQGSMPGLATRMMQLTAWRKVQDQVPRLQAQVSYLQGQLRTENYYLGRGIAAALVRQGDWDAVIAFLAPRNGLHQLAFGRALLRKGRLDEAINNLSDSMHSELSADRLLVIREVAEALEKNGRLDDALRYLEGGLWLRPEDAEIQFRIGNILARQDKLKEAVAAYKEALRWKPDLHDARYKLGTTLAQLGELDDAVAAYRHVLGVVANFEGAHRELGIALARQGNRDAAVTALQQAVRWWPKDALAHYHLGNVLAAGNRLDEAVAEYREAVRLQPGLTEANTALKSTLARLEKSEKVLAGLVEMVRRQPTDAQAHYQLGKELARLDKLDEAVAAYRAALKLRPRDGLFQHELGRALFRQDKFADAINAYREAVAVQPDDVRARYDLGYALSRSGKFNEAVTEFREVVGRQDDFAEAHGNLGIALSRLGKWKEAIVAFRKAVQLRPDDAVAYHNLAQALGQYGTSGDSIDTYREAFRRSPDEALGLSNLSVVLLRQERVDEAIATCREALRRRPDLAEAHSTLDTALAQMKELNQTIAFQEKLYRQQPDNGGAYYSLVNALVKAGRFEEALQLKPGSDAASRLAYSLGRGPVLERAVADCRQLLSKRPDDATLRIFFGTALSQRDSPDEAIDFFTEWIRREPKNRGPLLARAQVYRYSQQSTKALADLVTATELDSNDAETWAGRGSLHSQMNQVKEAIESYTKALQLRPDREVWRSARNSAYVRLRQWDKVAADATEALDVLPKPNVFFLLQRGDAYVKLEQWDKALADYAQVTKATPNNFFAWDKRSDVHALRGEWDKALAVLEEGIRAQPPGAWVPPKRAWLLATCPDAKLRDPARALKVLQETFKLSPGYPNNPDAAAALGAAHYRSGDFKAALEPLTKAAAAGFGLYSTSQLFFLAMTHQQLGNKPEAKKWYDQATQALSGMEKNKQLLEDYPLRIAELRRFQAEAADILGLEKPKSPAEKDAQELKDLMDRGMAFYQKGLMPDGGGQLNAALGCFTRATAVAPQNAEAWYWRGKAENILRSLLGRSEDEAEASLSRAVELGPKNPLYRHERALFYQSVRKQRDKAIADATAAIELDPRAAAYRLFRGAVYEEKEEWDKALADYSAALKNQADANHVPAWTKRADLYVRLCQWEKARSDYEEAIKRTPKHTWARDRLAWLLATCPEAAVRDPARAVELANGTLAIVLQGGAFWNTLGVARYRAGDWKAALEALNKCVEQSPGLGVPGSTYYFLAMTHHQLGNKEEARKWYDKAGAGMEKNQPKNEELRRFREEAAEVLGLEKPPKKAPPP